MAHEMRKLMEAVNEAWYDDDHDIDPEAAMHTDNPPDTYDREDDDPSYINAMKNSGYSIVLDGPVDDQTVEMMRSYVRSAVWNCMGEHGRHEFHNQYSSGYERAKADLEKLFSMVSLHAYQDREGTGYIIDVDDVDLGKVIAHYIAYDIPNYGQKNFNPLGDENEHLTNNVSIADMGRSYDMYSPAQDQMKEIPLK